MPRKPRLHGWKDKLLRQCGNDAQASDIADGDIVTGEWSD